MNNQDFLNLNTLKKLNKEFETHLDSIRHDYEAIVAVEWKGFVENQHVGYGRNGASTLVSLQSILHECKSIKFVRPYAKSSHIDLYIHAEATAGQGSREVFTRMVYKDKKGQTQTMSDLSIESLTSRFGRVYETVEPVVNVSSNVLSLVKQDSQADISEQVYKNFIWNIEYNNSAKIEAFCTERDIKFVEIFHYSHCFSIPVDNIKQNANKITFAFKQTATYNTLPIIISITKAKKVKTTRLCDIGLESKGSYSHSDKMMIRDEDVAAALAFKAEFDKV